MAHEAPSSVLIRCSTLLTVPVTCLTVLACGVGERAAWCPPAAEGVTVVANVGDGLWAAEGLESRLVELWRVGGTREGQELGQPIAVVASPGGRVAVPDFMLGEVVVIEPDGTWLGAWTRQGAGPGEVRAPVAAAWDGDDRLAVFDIMTPKVAYVGADGPVGEDLRVEPSFTVPVVNSGQFDWAALRADGTVYLQPAAVSMTSGASQRDDVSLVLALAPGASVVDTVARGTWVPIGGDGPFANWHAPGWPRLTAALGGGRVAAGGDVAEYRIVIHDAGERGPVQICRDARPLPMNDHELGRDLGPELRELADALRDARRPDTPAAFGRLVLGTHGRLWVQRERAGPADPAIYGPAGGEWDVFDPDGRYLGAVQSPEPAHLMAARGDTVWALEFGDFDEAWLVAYRLETAR